MRMIWLNLITTALCFAYFVPVLKTTENLLKSPFVFFLITSLIVASASFYNDTRKACKIKIYYWAIPAVIFCIFIPFPFNLGGYVILLGLLLHFFAFRNKVMPSAALGSMFTGVLFLVMSAVLPVFYVIGSRYHEIKLINAITWPFIKMLGLNASISENVMYFLFYEGVSAFPGTLEKLGLFLIFLLFSGGIFILIISGSSWKKYVAFVGTMTGYIFLRYVFLVVVFAQMNRANIFWETGYFVLSFIPLAVFLGFFVPIDKKIFGIITGIDSIDMSMKEWAAMILFFLGAVSLMGAWGFNDPGTAKKGRVLIDEIHSDWEWSLKEFDKTWFGSQSTYNYYCMSEYLDKYYHVEHNTENKLYDSLLNKYDVLILKTPTMAFSTREIDAIEKFVKKGGGLWMVGDHTNVFGMDYYLNFIAKRFGIFFHYDSTYDLDSGKLSYYKPPKIFPHPIVKDMDSFLFATSDTVSAPLTAENVMVGYGLKSRLLSYSGRAFFEKDPLQNYEFGLFLQSAAVKYGKGRVAVYTDSTVFSNFYMFIPGKPELALGTVEWLNRMNKYGGLPIFLAVSSVFLFAAGFILTGLEKNQKIILFFLSVLPGIVAGFLVFTYHTQKAYAPPVNHTDYKTVFFETEHSDVLLPTEELVDKHKKSIHTFFVWTQRLDYVPVLKDNYLDCLEKGSMTVVFNPVKPFSLFEVAQTVKFVKNGGKLLIIDGPQNSASTSHQLLNEFGFTLEKELIKSATLFNRENKVAGVAIKSGSIKGGDAWLKTKDGKAVFSVAKVGKGAVGVMADSHIFLNPQIGGTQIKPSPFQQRIYDAEFYIFETMENVLNE